MWRIEKCAAYKKGQRKRSALFFVFLLRQRPAQPVGLSTGRVGVHLGWSIHLSARASPDLPI